MPAVKQVVDFIESSHLDPSIDEYCLIILYTAQYKAGQGPTAISDEGHVAKCLGFDILGPIARDDIDDTEMQVVNMLDEHHTGGYNVRRVHGRIGDGLYVNPTLESLKQDLEDRRNKDLGERLDEALDL